MIRRWRGKILETTLGRGGRFCNLSSKRDYKSLNSTSPPDDGLVFMLTNLITITSNHFLCLCFTTSLFSKNFIKNAIGSLGVYLHNSNKPSVIWGITLSIKYCLIGLDFSFRICFSCSVSFYKSNSLSSLSSVYLSYSSFYYYSLAAS